MYVPLKLDEYPLFCTCLKATIDISKMKFSFVGLFPEMAEIQVTNYLEKIQKST